MALRRIGFIALPAGAETGFDHADCFRGERVYVAHTGADRIDVFDCLEQRFLRSLKGLPGVAGVPIDEEHGMDVPVDGPHGLAVDQARLYCAADGGAVVVLHADTGAVKATLPLPGVPDVVWHDPEGGRLYVAVDDPGCVSVLTRTSLSISKR